MYYLGNDHTINKTPKRERHRRSDAFPKPGIRPPKGQLPILSRPFNYDNNDLNSPCQALNLKKLQKIAKKH